MVLTALIGVDGGVARDMWVVTPSTEVRVKVDSSACGQPHSTHTLTLRNMINIWAWMEGCRRIGRGGGGGGGR